MPYLPPTREQITQALQLVHSPLDPAAVKGIIDSETRQPITDLSKPNENATLDNGPEKKFSIYFYPMGVADSWRLLAHEVTGDPRYADFVAKRHQYFSDHLGELAK